jgi:hypothetical protein
MVHRVRRFVCACFLTSELWGDVGPVGLNLLLLIRSVARGRPALDCSHDCLGRQSWGPSARRNVQRWKACCQTGIAYSQEYSHARSRRAFGML